MRYEITGSVLQTLDVHLGTGESVFTESGGMAWMRGDIKMSTDTRGGLLKGLARSLSGESLFLTTYTCSSGEAMVTFTPEAPGSVLPVELAPNESRICQKDAFMAAEDAITLEIHFRRKLGSGLFGGEGFVGHGLGRDRRRGTRTELGGGRNLEGRSRTYRHVRTLRRLRYRPGQGREKRLVWRRRTFPGHAEGAGQSLAAKPSSLQFGAQTTAIHAREEQLAWPDAS
jgi:hypothetical protein